MRVRLYTTDLPMPASEWHPIAVLPDAEGAVLPQHPDGLPWRYWVTTDTRDTMLRPLRPRIEAEIDERGQCVLIEPIERLLSPLPLNAIRSRAAAALRGRLCSPKPAAASALSAGSAMA